MHRVGVEAAAGGDRARPAGVSAPAHWVYSWPTMAEVPLSGVVLSLRNKNDRPGIRSGRESLKNTQAFFAFAGTLALTVTFLRFR